MISDSEIDLTYYANNLFESSPVPRDSTVSESNVFKPGIWLIGTPLVQGWIFFKKKVKFLISNPALKRWLRWSRWSLIVMIPISSLIIPLWVLLYSSIFTSNRSYNKIKADPFLLSVVLSPFCSFIRSSSRCSQSSMTKISRPFICCRFSLVVGCWFLSYISSNSPNSNRT